MKDGKNLPFGRFYIFQTAPNPTGRNRYGTARWGPEYRGRERIRLWFQEWNTRGTVLRWDIRQFFHKGDQTIVQWHFRNQMDDGRAEPFDGLSLIRWNPADRICFLQEFGCNENRYNPYQDGPEPTFRKNSAAWF